MEAFTGMGISRVRVELKASGYGDGFDGVDGRDMVVSMSNTYIKLYLPFVSSMNLPQVGALFAARRRLLGISEADLAAGCDIGIDLLRRLERGQYVPSPSQAYSLAHALHFDTQDVCTWAVKALFQHPQYLVEVAMRFPEETPATAQEGGEPCRSRRLFLRRSKK